MTVALFFLLHSPRDLRQILRSPCLAHKAPVVQANNCFFFFFNFRETEERAQTAEERAIQAETELKQALEKIRALERSASRASAGESQTPAERPVSTSMSKPAPSQASTAQPH